MEQRKTLWQEPQNRKRISLFAFSIIFERGRRLKARCHNKFRISFPEHFEVQYRAWPGAFQISNAKRLNSFCSIRALRICTGDVRDDGRHCLAFGKPQGELRIGEIDRQDNLRIRYPLGLFVFPGPSQLLVKIHIQITFTFSELDSTHQLPRCWRWFKQIGHVNGEAE